ncbi:MAG: hypothetical protein IPM53_21800 [Anaerolineaceae bacterium]|nr:hypothetical protein [Anaerolineaceae bacterium]
MTLDDHHAMQQWLAAATAKLPAATAELVTKEFIDHFLDAVEDYQAEGLSQTAAQTRALADLGTPEAVGRSLKDVHLGKPHYRTAAFASLLILVVMMGIPVLVYSLFAEESLAMQVSQVAMGVLIAVLTVYVLNMLRRLLLWRFDLTAVDKPLQVAIGSYVLWLTADTLSLLVYNAPLYVGSLRALGTAVSAFDKGLIIAAWAGQIGIGITGLVLARLLWRTPENLYGIGKPLAGCLVFMALPIGLAGLATNTGAETVVFVLSLLAMLGHIVIWPTLTLLFARAAFRPPNEHPPQLA